MNKELYNKIFERMDEFGAIRKDLKFGCSIIDTERESMNGEPFQIGSWFTARTENGEKYYRTNIVSSAFLDSHSVSEFEIEEGRIIAIGHHPVLSDCIQCFDDDISNHEYDERIQVGIQYFILCWDYSKQYLIDQSDELGEKLLELIKP